MAQRTVTHLVDDIDGKELQQDNGETVTFGLGGVTYEIDISGAHAEKLRDAFSVYVGQARRISGGTCASGSHSRKPVRT